MQKPGIGWYLASLLVMGLGSFLAAQHYPGGYDWLYTVASSLASKKHNPSGSVWFAGALVMAMVLLWFYVTALKKSLSPFGENVGPPLCTDK